MKRLFNLILAISVSSIQAKTLDVTEINKKAMLLYNASRQEGKDNVIKALKPLAAGALVFAGSVMALKKGAKFLNSVPKNHSQQIDFNNDWIEFLKYGAAFCAMGGTAFFAVPTVALTGGLGLLTLRDGVKKLRVESIEDIADRLKREQEDNNTQIEKKRDEQRIARNMQRKLLIAKKN